MRWDALFADLEARADELDRVERAVEVSDRARIEAARLAVADRLSVAAGARLHVQVSGGGTARGLLCRSGADWLLLDTGSGSECIVSIGSVLSIIGFDRWAASPQEHSGVPRRLGIRHVLRAVATDRSAVLLHLADGSTITGTIDRVGHDFLDLALHDAGEVRRRETVRAIAVVRIGAVSMIRRDR